MTPDEFKTWLENKIDEYASKDETTATIALMEVRTQFFHVNMWVKENMLTREWVETHMTYGDDY